MRPWGALRVRGGDGEPCPRLSCSPGTCPARAVGCSRGATLLGRERHFPPRPSGADAPVELMQGLLRSLRAVPGPWAGRGDSPRATAVAGGCPGSRIRSWLTPRWAAQPPAGGYGEVGCKPRSFCVISFKETFFDERFLANRML